MAASRDDMLAIADGAGRAPVRRVPAGTATCWAMLAAYVAVMYGMLPWGPRVGLAVLRSGVGGWLFGPGALVVMACGLLALLVALRRRGARPATYALLLVTAAGYVAVLWWLQAVRLERVHLPEYGIAAWLSWRAVATVLDGPAGRYLAAGTLAGGIGVGEELLQAIVPGRVCDPRDVVANVVAVALGLAALAVLRAAGVSVGSRA